jgi:hypothetical protein
MKPWSMRPIEVRNLFNPAFCALVLTRALRAYEEGNQSGMPFSLSLLILPLCLHRSSREILNRHARSYFLKVLTENPQLNIGFAQRATTLLPYSLEALGFAMHVGCFIASDTGRLQTLPRSVSSSVSGSDETIACQKAARLVGRQFAEISDRATIYTALGVRP